VKLKTIGDRLKAISITKLPVLETKAGTTERIRGRTWMTIRRRVLIAGNYSCVDCGRISPCNEIDHDKPLEQGGSNDDNNLRVRCIQCHAAKTADESRKRWGR
jgi:5-methylcytosine-specific restriction protein A